MMLDVISDACSISITSESVSFCVSKVAGLLRRFETETTFNLLAVPMQLVQRLTAISRGGQCNAGRNRHSFAWIGNAKCAVLTVDVNDTAASRRPIVPLGMPSAVSNLKINAGLGRRLSQYIMYKCIAETHIW